MPQGPGTYGSKVGRPPAEKKSPAGFKPYSPFRMKAADYGNSPMRKNFGVGDPEGPDAPSPNKFGMFGGGAWEAMKARRDAAGGGKGTGKGKNRGGQGGQGQPTQHVTATPNVPAGDDATGGAGTQMNEAISATGSTGVGAGAMFGEQGGSGGGNVPMHGPESHAGMQKGAIGGVTAKDPSGRPGKNRGGAGKVEGGGIGSNITDPSNPTYSASKQVSTASDYDKSTGKGSGKGR